MLGRGIVESKWKVIASEGTDAPETGQIMIRREAMFAYREEADMWLAEQMGEGFNGSVASAACSYFGPTDAPGNCWSVVAERIEGVPAPVNSMMVVKLLSEAGADYEAARINVRSAICNKAPHTETVGFRGLRFKYLGQDMWEQLP